MLVAKIGEERVVGWAAIRGLDYRCPGCGGALTVRQGRFVVHHFAHKPPITCHWAAGETLLHLMAKKHLVESFRKRGLRADVEVIVDTLPGDRRADVVVWSPKGEMIAFELQHSPIQVPEIEARAAAYARAGIAQMWLPFLRRAAWTGADRVSGGFEKKRYVPRRFEIWVHGFGGGSMWMYDPVHAVVWLASLSPHETYVEERSWYGEGGAEVSSGGYYKEAKRLRDLNLFGPFELDRTQIRLETRTETSLPSNRYPASRVAHFVRNSL